MGEQAMLCVVLIAAITCVLGSRLVIGSRGLLRPLCCLGLGLGLGLLRMGGFLGRCLGRPA